MSEEQQKITFTTGDGEEVEFYVMEQTKVNGFQYLLVADGGGDEANALILKEIGTDDQTETIYDVVEEENELEAIARVFEEILDDIEIQTGE